MCFHRSVSDSARIMLNYNDHVRNTWIQLEHVTWSNKVTQVTSFTGNLCNTSMFCSQLIVTSYGE